MNEVELKIWLDNTLKQSNDFQLICKPLFDKLPVSFIRLTRIFKNNSFAILSTRPDALAWYFSEKKYQFGAHELNYDCFIIQSGKPGFCTIEFSFELTRHGTS